jgi:hypothetical protein
MTNPERDGIFNEDSNTFTTPLGLVLGQIHDRSQCEGRPCVIHNQTDHNMRGWMLFFRVDRCIWERICPHGIGHPDPDDLAWHVEQGRDHMGVHGCDGCCMPNGLPPQEEA